MKFYGPRLGLHHCTDGGCNYDQPETFKKEVDLFRGAQRVWFLYDLSADYEAIFRLIS
jgi:hypothetical protein